MEHLQYQRNREILLKYASQHIDLCVVENSCLARQDIQLQEEFSVVLFETLCDWEKELKRLGASDWRVSPVNERFDMSTR